MSRVSAQPSTVWRSSWLLAALIAVAALALVVSQARPTVAQTAADIELTKTADSPEYALGDTVTFTIEIANNSETDAVDAGDLTVVDVVGPQLLGVAVEVHDDSDEVYDCAVVGNNTVTCTNSEGAHVDGVTHTITITGTAAIRGEYTNSVTGTIDEDEGTEELLADSVDYTITSSNISITKTADVERAARGGEIVFTLTVTNEAGEGVVAAASNTVTVADALPGVFDALTILDISGDDIYLCTFDGNLTVLCANNAEHAVGDTGEITITATVAAEAQFGDYTNSASASTPGLLATSGVEVSIGEIGRTISISKRIDAEGFTLHSVSGTIEPHEPSDWTIDVIDDSGHIEIEGVSDEAQTVTETSPSPDWTVEYAVNDPDGTCGDGEQGVPEDGWSSDPAVVPAGEDDYLVCIRNTYTPVMPDERDYLLTFRWSLIAWISPDMSIGDALRGEGQNEGGTDVFDDVTAIYAWDGQAQDWLAFFPAGVDVPGANDIEDLEFGEAYWIAIEGPADVEWTVIEHEADDEEENGE